MNTEYINNNFGLSIRFTLNGFSLYVTDKTTNLLISTKSLTFDSASLSDTQLLDLFEKQEEFKQSYNDLRIIVESDTYAVIPQTFHNSENAEKILKFQFPDFDSSQTIIYNELVAWNACIIFSINQTLFDVLLNVFPEISIEHHLFAICNDNVILSEDSAMYILARKNRADMIIIESGKLSLINSFKFENNEDQAYHIMNAFETRNLDKERCTLFLINQKNNELEKLLSQYIRNIKNTELKA